MKKLLLFIAISSLSTSCMQVKEIGKFNMISTRNVSMKEDYTLIKSYAGEGKKEIKRYKAETLEEAINNIVKSTPGGEFVMNVKTFLVTKRGKQYFAAQGDVYGIAQDRNYKGFKVGDHVQWKDNFVRYSGVITDLKNERECSVKQDDSEKIRVVRYSEMSKID